jgi:hypothetical protein
VALGVGIVVYQVVKVNARRRRQVALAGHVYHHDGSARPRARRGAEAPVDEQHGAAERLVSLVLGSGAHLWHNRPGVDVGGTWLPATSARRGLGTPVRPGLFVPAAEALYRQLLEIYALDPQLMAHFASYALVETEWRDLKVCCAALMLVQPRAGQPVRDADGSVLLYEDDYRAIGEAMVLWYQQGSRRMMTPKMVLRVGELLSVAEIAALNRQAGFADPAARKPPLGRWPKAARQWLAVRERNPYLMEGLVAAGYKQTVRQLARRIGYKPESERFFEVLGWQQRQADGGHRTVGLDGLELRKQERFDGLDEEQICERIIAEKLGFKETVGRLPAGTRITPAIMAALLPSLSDRDLRILTPTLESLGLLADDEVRARWEQAVQRSTDQRALNVARNVQSDELREKLESAADEAARAAVTDASAGHDVHVMFLIDHSASMRGAIEASKEALVRILAGFPPERLYIAAFNTVGRMLRPRAPTRAAVEHMLRAVHAQGGTVYSAGLRAFARESVMIPDDAKLVLLAVGDEAGEPGRVFADEMATLGYVPDAMALIVSTAGWRGRTVRDAAVELRVPYSEVSVGAFDDPYQITRVLTTLMEAPVAIGAGAWVERVLATPLLTRP